MEQITTTKTQYKAFDGKIFDEKHDCMMHEHTLANDLLVNLRNFKLKFPMQQYDSDCIAYFVKSENEYKMFTGALTEKYPDAFEYDDYQKYEGSGWYVTQIEESGWVTIYKLSDIVKEWSNLLYLIVDKTMDFKEV